MFLSVQTGKHKDYTEKVRNTKARSNENRNNQENTASLFFFRENEYNAKTL